MKIPIHVSEREFLRKAARLRRQEDLAALTRRQSFLSALSLSSSLVWPASFSFLSSDDAFQKT
ncbi:hypothetical protein GWU89_24420 [Salmonella enterica]|nr:hypothetical protein [Salmonella enterica]EEL8974612.1 hypothetical protein [Salmonella enterica]